MASTSLHYYLVSLPTISTFHWNHHETPASSISFLATTIVAYLTLTILSHRGILPLPTLSPFLLRVISSLHNLNLLLLSFTMALGCSLSSLHQMPSPSWLFCFPLEVDSGGPTFFWAYIFYLSKIYELADTALILLANQDSRKRRLTFLHVYHHSVVVIMCYVWLETKQSLMPVALVTNAGVHVAMYAYYLSAGLGWRWQLRWKRAITELQIWQFAFSFGISLVFLWLHFRRAEGCQGINGWIFNAIFNVSLFVLFLDFHYRAYKVRGMERKKRLG